MAKPLGPTGEFFRRRDEWRKHPMLTNQFRHATPGLGIALVAFGIYLVGDVKDGRKLQQHVEEFDVFLLLAQIKAFVGQ
ncbi:hypothetical protein E3N88_28245 [Mikania micrantha]|uniref:NADH dehydrogenase [ubiquinone] 1 beta subcomplex subunit 3-B n=1 Tax=Mikania micrantha TaxID=192012 RepID=A0A5N6MZV1_9ASTR|nr:hypothetical protein E3N88_28207 [Mikania micrantha]KAD4179654.1 hypothetical protein E3N88_28245 [Mikania micrantha]